MIRLQLAEAAALINAQIRGADNGFGFAGISSDSRQLQQGELFVALRGPHFDGHDYAGRAREKGAAAAMVERWLGVDLPQLKVTDCEQALGLLGAAWRARFQGRLIALTGSNGKTTTKEMLVSILSLKNRVSATKGNLNNQIGLPLTLARLQLTDAYAVIEMGANHQGEIAYLTALAKPDIALITNAGPAHLEGFGSLDGVARGKGEIFQGLGKSGTAIINADDKYAGYWRELVGGRASIEFGLRNKARVQGEILAESNDKLLNFRLTLDDQAVDIHLPLSGLHNVYNALGASAASWTAGAGPEEIKQGLERMSPVSGRLQRLAGIGGSTLINDTYNANPASLNAALESCRTSEHNNKCWLVLGDMAELGAQSQALHAAAGEQARAAGIQKLFTLGERSKATAQAFGAGGQHFSKLEDLINALTTELNALNASNSSNSLHLSDSSSAPVLIIKGSRSMQMERVVRALQAQASEH